jgi:hypothetical protein
VLSRLSGLSSYNHRLTDGGIVTEITEITLKRIYPEDEDVSMEIAYPHIFRGWRKFVGGNSVIVEDVSCRIQEALNTLGLAADYQIIRTIHEIE